MDTYTPLSKQHAMMELILSYYEKSLEALGKGVGIEALVALPVREQIGRYKYTTAEEAPGALRPSRPSWSGSWPRPWKQRRSCKCQRNTGPSRKWRAL